MVIIFGGFGSFSKSTRREAIIRLADIRAVHSFDLSTFITTYFPLVLFIVLYVGYKIWNKSRMINYDEMDFVTGSSIEVLSMVSSIAETACFNADPKLSRRLRRAYGRRFRRESRVILKLKNRHHVIYYRLAHEFCIIISY